MDGIHFARPIVGVGNITSLDSGVLETKILEILEIDEILILWPWLYEILYHLPEEARITSRVFWKPKSWKSWKLPKF